MDESRFVCRVAFLLYFCCQPIITLCGYFLQTRAKKRLFSAADPAANNNWPLCWFLADSELVEMRLPLFARELNMIWITFYLAKG
jgi:hypothetical protein